MRVESPSESFPRRIHVQSEAARGGDEEAPVRVYQHFKKYAGKNFRILIHVFPGAIEIGRRFLPQNVAVGEPGGADSIPPRQQLPPGFRTIRQDLPSAP